MWTPIKKSFQTQYVGVQRQPITECPKAVLGLLLLTFLDLQTDKKHEGNIKLKQPDISAVAFHKTHSSRGFKEGKNNITLTRAVFPSCAFENYEWLHCQTPMMMT